MTCSDTWQAKSALKGPLSFDLFRPSGCCNFRWIQRLRCHRQKDSLQPVSGHLTNCPGDRVSFQRLCTASHAPYYSTGARGSMSEKCESLCDSASFFPAEVNSSNSSGSLQVPDSSKQHILRQGAPRRCNQAKWLSLFLLESGAMDSICRKERLTPQLAKSAPAAARAWAVYPQQFMKSCLKRWVPVHLGCAATSQCPHAQQHGSCAAMSVAACTHAPWLELIASVPGGGLQLYHAVIGCAAS